MKNAIAPTTQSPVSAVLCFQLEANSLERPEHA